MSRRAATLQALFDKSRLALSFALKLIAKNSNGLGSLIKTISSKRSAWRLPLTSDWNNQSVNKSLRSEKNRFMYQFSVAALGLFFVSSISTQGAFFETGGAVSHAGYFVNPDDLKLSFEELVASEDHGFLVGLGSSTQSSLAQNAVRTEDVEHVVKPGEDLASIAGWYGLKDVNTIMWANSLDSVNVQSGTRLTIPAADGLRYAVKSGDSLEKIASRFQVAAKDIVEFNALGKNAIKKGQKLFIPNAKVTATSLIASNDVAQQKPVQTVAAATTTTRVASPTIDLPILQETAPTVTAQPQPTGVGITNPAAKPATTTNKQPEQQETAAPIVNATPVTTVAKPVAAPAAAAVTSGGWVFPAPGGCRITQGFHGGHLAVDCANKSGGDIVAARGGTVEIATCGRNGYGCYVVLNHQDGYKTLYAHFVQQPVVSVGQTVAAGQLLGTMGRTGWATGVHIHFELVSKGIKISPIGPIF